MQGGLLQEEIQIAINPNFIYDLDSVCRLIIINVNVLSCLNIYLKMRWMHYVNRLRFTCWSRYLKNVTAFLVLGWFIDVLVFPDDQVAFYFKSNDLSCFDGIKSVKLIVGVLHKDLIYWDIFLYLCIFVADGVI